MEQRTQKQLIIGFIFVLIVSGIGYGFVDYFLITEATCFDNTKNGQEEGVDCGLLACGVACEPAIMTLNIQPQKLIEIEPGDYDFVSRVNNPNSFFGAILARYSLVLSAEDGTSFNKTGTFYMLPGQTRYLIVSGIRSNSVLNDGVLNITEVEWGKVEEFENISFPIQSKNYAVIDKNGTFSEFEAIILNNSDFDFDKVEVGVVLFGEDNNIVAADKTDIRTFISRTERYFKVNWPVKLPANIARQDIEVLTNVFENSNFIKRYGTQERFQKYY